MLEEIKKWIREDICQGNYGNELTVNIKVMNKYFSSKTTMLGFKIIYWTLPYIRPIEDDQLNVMSRVLARILNSDFRV